MGSSVIVEQLETEKRLTAEIESGWTRIARRIFNLIPTELATWRDHFFFLEATMPDVEPHRTNRWLRELVVLTTDCDHYVLNFRDDGGSGFFNLDDVVAGFERLAVAWSGIIEVEVTQYKAMGHVTVKFRASGI